MTRLNETAASWWVRQDRGALQEHESIELEKWLAVPEHARAYERVAKSWATLEGAETDPTIAALRQAALEIPRATGWGSRRTLGIVGALAATCAAIAIGFVWLQPHAAPTSAIVADVVSYRTQTGEQQAFELADGSRITLDAQSELDVAFSESLRLVNLHKGRARFEVAHDARRPFVVQAAGHRARAVGTAFDVRVADGELDILLVEGRLVVERVAVATSGAAAPVTLTPGQRFTLHPGGMPPFVAAANVKRETLWTQGVVEFDDERLDVAVAELNRYAVRPILIRDPSVASMKISGIFRMRQTQRFLDVVQGVLPVKVRGAADAGAEIVPEGDR